MVLGAEYISRHDHPSLLNSYCRRNPMSLDLQQLDIASLALRPRDQLVNWTKGELVAARAAPSSVLQYPVPLFPLLDEWTLFAASVSSIVKEIHECVGKGYVSFVLHWIRVIWYETYDTSLYKDCAVFFWLYDEESPRKIRHLGSNYLTRVCNFGSRTKSSRVCLALPADEARQFFCVKCFSFHSVPDGSKRKASVSISFEYQIRWGRLKNVRFWYVGASLFFGRFPGIPWLLVLVF